MKFMFPMLSLCFLKKFFFVTLKLMIIFFFFVQTPILLIPSVGCFGWLFFDKMAMLLGVLSIFMSVFVMKKKNFLKKFLAMNLLVLMLAFCFGNFILFFVFFEMSLIPILFIVVGWGSTPERLAAASYLLMYTLIFSVPFFFLLVLLYKKEETFSFGVYKKVLKNSISTSIDWIMLFWILCFFVKVPVYGLHLWLAKAHVEAPVFGSMLLAAVLLKLGLYGLLRSFLFWNFKLMKMSKFFFMYLFFGFILPGLICFRQVDMKSLMAYSSVQHMMLGVMGLMTFSNLNLLGVLLIAIFHGFTSSALFFGFKIMYSFSKTRKILLNFGLLKIFSLFVFLWFMALALNSGTPPTGKFFSELILIFSMMEFWVWIFPFLMMGTIFSGLFSIFLYSITSHGKKKKLFSKFSGSNIVNMNLLSFQCMMPIFGIFFMSSLW